MLNILLVFHEECEFHTVETNVIHATTYGNENVFCQSAFHTIISLMIQAIKMNYKKIIRRDININFCFYTYALKLRILFLFLNKYENNNENLTRKKP